MSLDIGEAPAVGEIRVQLDAGIKETAKCVRVLGLLGPLGC